MYSFDLIVKNVKVYEYDLIDKANSRITFKITKIDSDGTVNLEFSERVEIDYN